MSHFDNKYNHRCNCEEKFEVEERGLIDRTIIGMGYYLGFAFIFIIISLIYMWIKDLWESWSRENTFVYILLKITLALVIVSLIIAGIYYAKEYFNYRMERIANPSLTFDEYRETRNE